MQPQGLSYPSGVPYPYWMRQRILNRSGTVRERAELEGVSVSTVRRVDRATNNMPHNRESSARFKLDEEDAYVLGLFKMSYPVASLEECQQLLALGQGKIVSASTVSRELQRMGFSRKRVQRYSCRRDETQRVAFWRNPPEQGGCFGVCVDDLVDLDESCFPFEKARRTYGHMISGLPARVASEVR
jgi:transposase